MLARTNSSAMESPEWVTHGRVWAGSDESSTRISKSMGSAWGRRPVALEPGSLFRRHRTAVMGGGICPTMEVELHVIFHLSSGCKTGTSCKMDGLLQKYQRMHDSWSCLRSRIILNEGSAPIGLCPWKGAEHNCRVTPSIPKGGQPQCRISCMISVFHNFV
jgi:hypothetical protein